MENDDLYYDLLNESEYENDPSPLGHRLRLRRKLRSFGLNRMKDHEILEFLLSYCVPRRDVSDLAKSLCGNCGGLGGVFALDKKSLLRQPGMTRTIAEWILQLSSLMEDYKIFADEPPIIVNNVHLASMFLQDILFARHDDYDQTWQLALSNDGRLLSTNMLCDSAYWGTPATGRDVLICMAESRSPYMILVIYTANNYIRPEKYDRMNLLKLAGLLRASDCCLLDCIIYGDTIHSMNLSGEFDKIKKICKTEKLVDKYYLTDLDKLADFNWDEGMEDDDDDYLQYANMDWYTIDSEDLSPSTDADNIPPA